MQLRPSAKTHQFSWVNAIWIGGVHLIALLCAYPYFSWQGLVAFLVMYYATGMFGITLGFHRLLTHRAFKTKPFMENILAVFGTLACQGGPVTWVGTHRVHHAFSDTPEDPHNAAQGFWQSHILWIFNRRQDLASLSEVSHYAPDMASKPFFVWLDKWMIWLQIAFGFTLLGLGGFLHFDGLWDGTLAWSIVTWGVFVRLCAVYHVTWFVNSASHHWGFRTNSVKDLSTNNWWVGILAFGEGWHNNHHAQPRSARHGWAWWQLDQTWIVIQAFKRLGLFSHIHMPRGQEGPKDMGAPSPILVEKSAVKVKV